MTSYIVRRLLASIPLLFVVSFLVFFLSRAGGRDPVDAILGEKGTPETRARVTKELGLDKPLIVQYGIYIKGVLSGDLGTSYIRSGESVGKEIRSRFPATIELTFAAMFIAILIGIPAGILSAVRPRSWIDYLGMSVSLAGVSIPVFWLGLLLVLAFKQWLPVSGNIDPAIDLVHRTGFTIVDCALAGDGRALVDALRHIVLPAATLSTIPLAMTARITRSSMLEVLGSDYVRTARAKGLSPFSVVARHAFRNALVPVVTLIDLEFGYLLGGAVLTETVFDWPGMGTYTVHAVFQTDPVSICGASLVIATTFIVANLAVDVLYAFIDPRVRYGYWESAPGSGVRSQARKPSAFSRKPLAGHQRLIMDNRKLRVLRRHWSAMAGLGVLVLIAALSLGIGLIARHDPAQIVAGAMEKPSAEHWLGTDDLGRDVFARLGHGGRVSLGVGLAAVAVSLFIGVPLGAVAGYFGGWSDLLISRLVEVMLSLPTILLAILIAASMGKGADTLVFAVGIVGIPQFARQVRGSVLTLREQDFVQASRALGASPWRTLFHEVLPNALGPIIVLATLGVGSAILTAAGLSFLGLGVETGTPEWGAMLYEGRRGLQASAHLAIFSGLAITLAVLAINLFGDGLRDALDPRAEKKV